MFCFYEFEILLHYSCLFLVYGGSFFFFFLSYLLSVVSASKVDFLNFPLQNQTSCEFLV